MLFRKYVSKHARNKRRMQDVLKGVGLDPVTIAACASAHPFTIEETVQEGLVRWCESEGTQPPTWEVLLMAMESAKMTRQLIRGLEAELGMLFAVMCCVCVCVRLLCSSSHLLSNSCMCVSAGRY